MDVLRLLCFLFARYLLKPSPRSLSLSLPVSCFCFSSVPFFHFSRSRSFLFNCARSLLFTRIAFSNLPSLFLSASLLIFLFRLPASYSSLRVYYPKHCKTTEKPNAEKSCYFCHFSHHLIRLYILAIFMFADETKVCNLRICTAFLFSALYSRVHRSQWSLLLFAMALNKRHGVIEKNYILSGKIERQREGERVKNQQKKHCATI